MKKWLIGGGFLGVLAIAALLGIIATGVFAQGATSEAAITPEQAESAVLAANPGSSVVTVDQDKESGVLVYEVQLDNGVEVQVDAGSGAILGTDQEDADTGAGDADNVQEEVQSQDNDADEGAGDLDSGQQEVESQDDDSGQGGNDLDDVEDEFDGQADDAQEAPGVEDAPGQ